MHFASIFALSLLCVFSISCDDKELSPEEQEKQATEKNLIDMTFWGVAGQLSNGCEQVDDWQSARLEANIGQPSQQSDATRLVLVNDAEAALERFSALISTDLPDYTVSHEWKLDGAGSLTYRKQTDGTAWATVDVDLKQFPGLKRIVYCAPEQQGLNGDFNGTAYYRFGDVIRKKNSDGNWDYWICVRPAFGKEGKQDMHWVTFSDFPEKNIKKYVASTNDTYYLPTQLSGAYSKIHWQNAAEMLFAILHPQEWRDNFDRSGNNKLDMFNDFKRSKISYHNQYFWQRVQNAWEKHGLFNQLLHFDQKTLANDMKSIRFIYYGYKWKWTFTWEMTLWAQEYGGMENNFHTFKALEKTENVKNKPFNVHEYGKYGEHSEGYQPFPRFTYPCRYSTGKELAGFTPNEYSSIATSKNGIEEVYRYNKEYEVAEGPGEEPEVCTKEMVDGGSKLSHGFFKPGTIIRDSWGARWLCYLHWINEPEMGSLAVGGGNKARFICLEDIVSSGEEIENKANPSANFGFFAKNLIPEKELPKLAYCIWQFAFQESFAEKEVRQAVEENMGIKLKDLFTHRDSLFDSGKRTAQSSIYATNFLYEPDGGRKQGTQPYMRYVMDGTHVGGNRGDLPRDQQYWMHRFFKKSSDKSDQRPLNLVDLFKVYERLVNDTIKADQWSHCKRHGTDYRDPHFIYSDCYDDEYFSADYFKYNTFNASWAMTFTGDGITRPKYVSAYWEPIIVARYMELEDTNEEFQETYKTGDGKTEKFTKIYEPSINAGMQLYSTYWGTLYNSVGETWMDYVPFNMTSE